MQTRLIKDYFGAGDMIIWAHKVHCKLFYLTTLKIHFLDGIEFQLGRVPIGGSDFSTRPYSYDDHPNDDNLTMFALQPEDVHFKVNKTLFVSK